MVLRTDVYDVNVETENGEPPSIVPCAFLTCIQAAMTEDGIGEGPVPWDVGLLILADYLQTYVFAEQPTALHEFMELFWPPCAQLCAAPCGSDFASSSSFQRHLKVRTSCTLSTIG